MQAAVHAPALAAKQESTEWFQTLETLGVPFLLYGRTAIRDYSSPFARALIADHPALLPALLVADEVVREQLSRTKSHLHIGALVPAREIVIPAARLALGIYVTRERGSVTAVVIIRPEPRAAERAIDSLSRRESEVAKLIAAGLSTKEIALSLGISSHTARHHTERLFAKLSVRSRASVAAIVGAEAVRV